MLHRFTRPYPVGLLTLVGLVTALLISCSSPRSSQPTEDASTDSGPSLSLLYTSADDGLVLFDARRDLSQTLRPESHFDGARAVSPSGRYLAFSHATADSSHLALLDLSTHTLLPVHAASGPRVYSLSWHPVQDRLAFGFYRPTGEKTRGRGDIRVATPEGKTRSVGCRAAQEVLHWLPDGLLATRDEENLYVVAADDCATHASRDARRMHQLTYAPDGRRLAYIHRELRYDRSIGEYVPDSSLVVSDAHGKTPETLFGDERRVRHLRWAPDASELAFDVRGDDVGHRRIAVYNGDRTFFLTPPNQTSSDQVHPRWSPSGTHIAFTLREEGGSTAAVRVEGQTRHLGAATGPVWGWIDDRSVVVPGPDSLRVQTLDGATRFTHPTPETLIHAWTHPPS